MLSSVPDYLVEGDAFTPHHVDELKQKYELKAVFLTMSRISTTDILKFAKFDNWASENIPMQLKELAASIVAASKVIEEECEHFGVPCFDMSDDYDANFEKAYKSLLH
jgi:hypothetical protein